MSLRDYVAVFMRRKWLILAAVVVSVACAALVSYTTTPLYQSTTNLIYQRQTDISTAIAGVSTVSSYDVDRELLTAVDVVASETIQARAAKLLNGDAAGASVSASAVKDTNMLTITAIAPRPQVAAASANAYAAAFIAWRREGALKQIQDAEKIIESKLARYTSPADKLSTAYVQLVGRLQDLRVLEAMATGNYVIAQKAVPASAPFKPNHPRNLFLGLAIGIVAGLGLALLGEQLDVRVRSQDELSQALRLPVIGRIPQLEKSVVQSGNLAVLAEPDGMAAEAYRMLRGNLDFVSVDVNLKSILVTSCTQAEGKTSTVCNLAVTLARAGKRVVVVEADLRRPKIHRYFGLANDVGVSSVVSGRVKLADALKPIPMPVAETAPSDNGGGPSKSPPLVEDRLQVLTSGPLPPNPGEIVTSRRIGTMIEELAKQADLVLVDSPPFFAVGDAAALAANVDGVVLVMKMGHITKAMVKEAHDFLATLPCNKLGIVLTNFSPGGAGSYRYRYYRHYASDKAAAGQTEATPVA